MTKQEIREAINVRTKAVFFAANTIVVIHDGDPADSPNDALFIKSSIQFVEQKLMEKGDTERYRQDGFINLQLIAPTGDGYAAFATVEGLVDSNFRGVTASGIHYRTPQPGQMRLEEGKDYELIRVFFYADDTQ